MADAEISLKDVWEEQIKLTTTVAVMLEQMKTMPDHEQRLRSLERWRYGLPLAGLMSAGSMILAAYSWLHR